MNGAVDAGLAVFAVSVMMELKAARGTDEQSARLEHICQEHHSVDGLWEQSAWPLRRQGSGQP